MVHITVMPLCSNSCCQTSVKVFAHVLLSRIDPLLLSKRRFEESGFTLGRSTLDAILALRLLSEVHREFSQPLHVAFVDLKAAFDSMDRLAL